VAGGWIVDDTVKRDFAFGTLLCVKGDVKNQTKSSEGLRGLDAL
jgi:hypothetical protein